MKLIEPGPAQGHRLESFVPHQAHPAGGAVMILFRLLLNLASFGVFCGVLYLLSPPILFACLAAFAAYGLWTLVDALCDRLPHLSQK